MPLKSIGLRFSTTKIKVGDYEDCRDADIIVNSIGIPRKPGQTRLDMLDDSIRMLRMLLNLKKDMRLQHRSSLQLPFHGLYQ